MDFEQYLEQDILKFLDSKMQKEERKKVDREEEYGLYLSKDYLKELNFALSNDELTRAKKLFDELKEAYENLPKSSPDRKKTYSLLEKMYGKIQNYAEIKEGKIEVIKEGASEIQVQKSSDPIFSKPKKEFKLDTQEVIDHKSLPIMSQKEQDEKKAALSEMPIAEKSDIKVGASEEAGLLNTQKEEPLQNKVIAKEEKPSESSKIEQSAKTREQTKDIQEADLVRESKKTTNADGLRSKEDYSKSISIDLGDKTDIDNKDGLKEELEELKVEFEEKTHEQDLKIDELREEIIGQINDDLNSKKSSYGQLQEYEPLHHSTKQKIQKQKSGMSTSEMRATYEEAIYHMFEGQYEEAADLFDKIIRQHSVNNAARIRMAECIRHAPELAEKYSIPETVLFSSPNLEEKSEENMKEHIIQKRHMEKNDIGHEKAYGEKELKGIYDHGVIAMQERNYKKAAKIFSQLVRINPSDSLSKERLQRCLEAMGNG